MANEINIDSLAIEIKSDASKAADSLEDLATKLDRLSAAAQNVKGLAKVTTQIQNLSNVSAKVNTSSINRVTFAIERLSNLTMPNFTKTANSLSKLHKSIIEINSIGDLSGLAPKINEIVTAVKPLETLGKNSLSPFLASLKQIPKITQSIDTSTMERFREIIQETLAAITPLADRVDRSANGLVALNGIIQATTRNNGNNAASNASLAKSYTSLGSVFKSVRVRALAYFYVMKRVASMLGSALSESNAYVENINLFTVAMGDAADEAMRFAEKVNDALGIDTSAWIRTQGTFRQILSGFGVVNDKATLMSQNLTQISYDISSFFNIGTDEAIQKVEAGISGELEPLIVAA